MFRNETALLSILSKVSKSSTRKESKWSSIFVYKQFRKIEIRKSYLKATHLTSVEEVQVKTENLLKVLSRPRSRTVTSNYSTERRSVKMLKGVTLKVMLSR
ncbi:hypothetical protein TNCV_4760361 [Trichonephila clavipes]|uniref:Uncharacterized protein n=1 Tax=Trichonephila clavipes TaxID=2585209 RepID=A0A8X6RIG4_TRICX|nr:hypothetical protein TNCV_4760361 [Trichonephila clavipes]